jgi:hypothetical protein
MFTIGFVAFLLSFVLFGLVSVLYRRALEKRGIIMPVTHVEFTPASLSQWRLPIEYLVRRQPLLSLEAYRLTCVVLVVSAVISIALHVVEVVL